MGLIGGTFELLFIGGSVLVSTITHKLFNNTLFERLYQVEDFKTPLTRVEPKTKRLDPKFTEFNPKGNPKFRIGQAECFEEEKNK